MRGKIRRCVPLVKLGLHGLHHNDGIIYHRTDDEHQGKQREQIEREAHHGKKGKCAHQRNENRDGRNQRGTQILKKHIHHQDDEQDGLYQCLYHVSYRSIQKFVGVIHYLEMQFAWQVFFYLLQIFLYAVHHLGGIRTRLLEYLAIYAGLAVGNYGEAVVQASHLHLSHVFHSEHFSVWQRLDYDVAKLLRGLPSSRIAQGVLKRVFRIFAQRTCSRFDVLF